MARRKITGRYCSPLDEVLDSDNAAMARLVRACEAGDANEVLGLLKTVKQSSFPREKLESLYRPPIYWATKNGHLEIVQLLISRYPGCNPYLVNCGHSLLYVACARGHINVANYLYEVFGISPTEPNSHGTTPIFAATNNGHYNMLNFLIYNLDCNPKALNRNGESLLHVACLTKHLKIVRYLIEVHGLNPQIGNRFQKTPLHLACIGGSLTIVKHLIKDVECKTDVFDDAGSTPLHNASRNGFCDIVQYFIEMKCNLALYDSSGNTPFHVACQYGRSEVVRVLLKKGKVDPNVPTLAKLKLSQLTKDAKTMKELIRGGLNTSDNSLDIFEKYKLGQPLHSTVHIFLIGHSASGKTTLVTALQKPPKILFIYPSSSPQVAPNTAGVVPIDCESPEFGKILFYDFAGHYDYHPSHAALLEHSKFASSPLFLLLINLTDSLTELKRKVNYWILFVENHCILKSSSPHVIIVGSHPDLLPRGYSGNVHEIQSHIISRLKPSNLVFKGFYSIDCRVPSKVFRVFLKECCSKLHTNTAVDPPCHVLSVILLQHFSKTLACTIQDVAKVTEEFDYPLPMQPERVCELAESVSARTKMLFLRNNFCPENSWIVINTDALLHRIHGKIFAPSGIPDHIFQPTQAGVLPLSQITTHFPDLDTALIVTFLHRLELCQVISDSEVLNLIEGKKGSELLIGQSQLSDNDSDDEVDSPKPRPLACLNPPFTTQSSRSGEAQYAPKEAARDGTQPPKRGPFTFTRESTQACFTRSHSDSMQSRDIFLKDSTTMYPAHCIPSGRSCLLCGNLHHGHKEHLCFSMDSMKLSQVSHKASRNFEPKDKYLFFPCLISPEQPSEDMWSKDGIFEYYMGWCLQCTNDNEFFSLRFLQTLLLRLSFSFAVSKSTNSSCEQLECTLWKNGLRWLNLNGIETIVEFVEDRKALVVLMRVKHDSIVSGLHLRSAVIRKILDTKKEYSSQIVAAELHIHPDHLKARQGYPVINRPISELTRYEAGLVALAFCNQNPYIFDTKRHTLTKIEDILSFDPYMKLGERFIRKLYVHDNLSRDLSQDILLELSQCYPEKQDFFGMILLDHYIPTRLSTGRGVCSPDLVPFNYCFNIMHSFTDYKLMVFSSRHSLWLRSTKRHAYMSWYWESGKWTLADLRKRLDMYSIFQGRNILTIAGV